MALDFDIKDDLRYKKGLQEGKSEGQMEKMNDMIISLLKKGKFSIEDIAEAAKVSIEYVQALADTLKDK